MQGNYAIVVDGVITNVASADSAFAAEQGWLDISQFDPVPWIGWTSSDGNKTWQPPPPPAGQ